MNTTDLPTANEHLNKKCNYYAEVYSKQLTLTSSLGSAKYINKTSIMHDIYENLWQMLRVMPKFKLDQDEKQIANYTLSYAIKIVDVLIIIKPDSDQFVLISNYKQLRKNTYGSEYFNQIHKKCNECAYAFLNAIAV